MSLTYSETLCRDRLMGKRQAVIGRGIVRVDLGSWLGILDNEPLQMLCIYPLCTLSPNLLSGSVTDSYNGGLTNGSASSSRQHLATAIAHVSASPTEI